MTDYIKLFFIILLVSVLYLLEFKFFDFVSTIKFPKKLEITTGYEVTADLLEHRKGLNFTDFRHSACLNLKNGVKNSEKISVIIVFYNEPTILIKRTMESFVSKLNDLI
mgnify:CR=1 FL=1